MNLRTLTRPGNDPELRSKAVIFLLCFLFSSVAWLFIKLSREAATVLPLELNITNIPDELVLTHRSDTAFALSVKTTGIKILTTNSLRNTNKLEADFTSLQKLRGNDNTQFFYTATQAEIRFSMLNEIPRTGLKAHPDTIFFTASEAFLKKVPVVVQKELDFRPGFKMYDLPISFPDSVYVRGPVVLKDSVNFIETEPLKVNQADKNIQTQLPLINPYPDRQLHLSEQQVDVTVPIAEFTESTAELPLHIDCPEIDNKSSGNQLMLFPEKVTVFYLVALKDINSISPDMFTATVSCPDTLSRDKPRLKTHVVEYPGLVEIIRTKPQEVEYVWIKK